MKKLIGVIVAALFAGSVVAGDAEKGKALTMACAGCHGADGNSVLDPNPSLAGQGEKYLVKQLKDFKSGDRQSAVMAPMANMVADADLEHVAAYFASQTIKLTAVKEEFLKSGEMLYRAGDADRNVPACMACHGADGKGMPAAGFPALGGQRVAYTVAQLKAFRDSARTNDVNKVMRDVVAKMSDEQIEAVANYLTGLH